jgi:hypothetical protein
MTDDPEPTQEGGPEDNLEVTKDTIKDLDPQDADDVKGGGRGFSRSEYECPV